MLSGEFNCYAVVGKSVRLYHTASYSISSSAPDDERVIRSKHVEQEKNGGIKIMYKNCASRWSSAHCNMMHGTYNVKRRKNSRRRCDVRTYSHTYSAAGLLVSSVSNCMSYTWETASRHAGTSNNV